MRGRSSTPWRPKKTLTPVRVQRPGLRALPKRIIALLGKMPDRALAAKAGVHPGTIFHERRRRGIAAFQQMSPPVEWTPAMIRELGTGTDREVAAELGIGIQAVTRKRQLLGIPPANQQLASAPHGYPWQPEEIALLGKVSDRAVAKELGISTERVLRSRLPAGGGSLFLLRLPIGRTPSRPGRGSRESRASAAATGTNEKRWRRPDRTAPRPGPACRGAPGRHRSDQVAGRISCARTSCRPPSGRRKGTGSSPRSAARLR